VHAVYLDERRGGAVAYALAGSTAIS
jgi:hypothetical protein